jgi:hypothetical protein
MLVLIENEVNIKEIKKRFKQVYNRSHKLNLRFGKLESIKEQLKIHQNDLEAIAKEVAKDYEGTNYDLIYISGAYVELFSCDRIAICSSEAYNLKSEATSNT